MKKSFFLLGLLVSGLLLSSGFNSDEYNVAEAAIGTTPTVQYDSELSDTYYSSVDGLTGDALLEGLATLSQDKHLYFNNYNECRGGNAYSDVDPNDSSKIIDFYTGWSFPNDWDNGTTWNREHVWCKSLSGGMYTSVDGTDVGAGADLHHIRPLISSINSTRSNALYTDQEHCEDTLTEYVYTGSEVEEYTGQGTGNYYFKGGTYNTRWEPRDASKGDVARILMYLYMHYSTEVSANSSYSKAGDLVITNIVYTSTGTSDAAWDMLFEWSKLDPVDALETNRNNYCASVTGVRNPFIDNAKFVNAIWGDGTLTDPNEGESSGDDSTSTDTTNYTYTLVTDVNDLKVGSNVVIAASGYDYALSTNQKTSNRGQAAITRNGNNITLTSDVEEFTLENGNISGTYAFNEGEGYIYASSSSNNELKTETTLSNNSSWSISINSGIATITSQGENTHNIIKYNSSSSLFSCYTSTSTMKDVSLYIKSTSEGEAGGETTNPEPVTNVNVTFDANGGTFTSGDTTYTSTTTSGSTLTDIPANPNKDNNTFVGWSIDGTTTIDLSTYAFSSDISLIALWQANVVEETVEGTYQLVTDVSTLSNGDSIVIAALNADNEVYYALSTTQNSNNRSVAVITKSDNIISFEESAGVEVFTLESGTLDNTFSFKGEAGYIYAASSSSNYLRTETKKSDNSSWSITIDSATGDANVVAQGTYTRNALRYNSANNLFSCYTSVDAQYDICLYKLVTSSSVDPSPDVKTAGDYFTENKTTTKLTASYVKETKEETINGTYTYTFEGKQFSSNSILTLGERNWTLAGDGGYWGYDGTKGQQFGSSGNPYTAMTLTSESFSGVNSIKINTSGASSVEANLIVTVGGTQIGETISLTSTATDYTFTADSSLNGEIVLSYNQTSSKAIYIKSIEVNYNGLQSTTSYKVTDASLAFGTLMSSDSYNSEATYGILVVPTTSLGSNSISDFVGENTSVDGLITSLKNNSIPAINYERTPEKVNANGVSDVNGEYYQFGMIFNNALASIDVSLTAIAYMEYDGKIYITANQTSYSLRELCQAYVDQNVLSGNEDAEAVLDYIINY